jgi:hypothetical protein
MPAKKSTATIEAEAFWSDFDTLPGWAQMMVYEESTLASTNWPKTVPHRTRMVDGIQYTVSHRNNAVVLSHQPYAERQFANEELRKLEQERIGLGGKLKSLRAELYEVTSGRHRNEPHINALNKAIEETEDRCKEIDAQAVRLNKVLADAKPTVHEFPADIVKRSR